jgi:hypothetical protein
LQLKARFEIDIDSWENALEQIQVKSFMRAPVSSNAHNQSKSAFMLKLLYGYVNPQNYWLG